MRFIVATITTGFVLASPLAAAEFDFDPGADCSDAITAASPQKSYNISMWAAGYRMATQSTTQPMTFEKMDALWSELKRGCEANPQASLVELLSEGAATGPEGVLQAFFAPDADVAALTAELRPTEADIRAVYNEPLATALIENYTMMYDMMAEQKDGLRPAPEQTDLLIVATTTDELKVNSDIRDKFPGGYGSVLSYMNDGFPIVRFKFVEPGESSGRAFDGLIFVNDHWVLMPKPWRSLD